MKSHSTLPSGINADLVHLIGVPLSVDSEGLIIAVNSKCHRFGH